MGLWGGWGSSGSGLGVEGSLWSGRVCRGQPLGQGFRGAQSSGDAMLVGAVIPWGQAANAGGAVISAGTAGAKGGSSRGAGKEIQGLVGSGCW